MQVQSITLRGDSDKDYTVTAQPNGGLYCTCPAWKFSRKAIELRVCKHIDFLRSVIKAGRS